MPSKARSRLLLVVTGLALAALAAYGISTGVTGSRPPVSSTPLRKVTVAQFGDFFLYAPLYVALDAGLFRDQGLDVTIVNTGGDDKTWAAVLGGSAEFGVADPTFIAVSAERGQPGVVISNLVNGVPFWGITYKNMRPILSPKELGSYSVATFPSPSTAYALQKKMFADGGLAPNIREAGFGAIISTLKAGRADIGLELEPNVSQAVADGASIVYSLASRYGEFAITGVTTTEARLQTDSQTVGAMRRGLQNAMNLLHTDRARSLSLLQRRFPTVPPAIAGAALDRALNEGVVPKSTTISTAAWDRAIDLRRATGDLSRPAAYQQFVRTGEPLR